VMSYQFTFSQNFKKHFKKMSVHEKKQITNKLKLLAENPAHPSLRTKRIKGADGLYESSASMDIRLIWYYEGTLMIIIVDVGHHDILKQF